MASLPMVASFVFNYLYNKHMAIEISIRDLKTIKELDFSVPTTDGVFLITGLNGCGKTSLLVALHRIKYGNAFRDNFVQVRDGVDEYQNSTLTYVINGQEVKYRHKEQRWVPTPKKNSSILNTAGISTMLFLSTSERRFLLPEKTKIPTGVLRYRNASTTIIQAMNRILGTTKFNNLKYIKLARTKGTKKRSIIADKLYIVKEGGNVYSQFAFSLGERLLLTVLDFIDSIEPNSILIIDEIELALHPIAQTKLYDHLNSIAKEKQLRVLLSTHSSSLIKHANKVIYLENKNGYITVIPDCRPAYVLKDVSAMEERNPDYLIFVEDIMAKQLLEGVIMYSKVAQKKHRVCRIVPVGGWAEVMKMTNEFYQIPPFNNKKVCCFLDEDVKDTIMTIRKKGADKTENEERILSVANTLNSDGNLHYLNITPELGVWNWIKNDPSDYMSFLIDNHGDQLFSIHDFVNEIDTLPPAQNPREEGKQKLSELAGKIMEHIAYQDILAAYKDMLYAYAKYCNSVPALAGYYVGKIESLLNRY